MKRPRVVALAAMLLALSSQLTGQQPYGLRAEVRMGSLDGPDALTEPGFIAVSRSSVVAVAQPQEAVVRLFRPDGSLSGTVGRRGAGPGEFRALVNIGFRGDTLWVSDPALGRLSYFAMDGTLLAELSWPGSMYLPDQPLPNGTFAASAVTRNGVGPVDPNRPWPVIVFSRDGTVLDTIGTIQSHSRQLLVGGRRLVSPIGDGAISSLSPGGTHLAVVDRRVPTGGGRGQYTVTWINMLKGDTLGRHSAPYEAQQMPREAVAQLVTGLAGSGAPPEHVADVRRVLNAQAYMPPVSRVVAGEDAVWLARESLGRSRLRWERFTVGQGLVGTLDLPRRSRIVAARGEHIWVVEKDDFDVSYVVRYRLSAPVRR